MFLVPIFCCFYTSSTPLELSSCACRVPLQMVPCGCQVKEEHHLLSGYSDLCLALVFDLIFFFQSLQARMWLQICGGKEVCFLLEQWGKLSETVLSSMGQCRRGEGLVSKRSVTSSHVPLLSYCHLSSGSHLDPLVFLGWLV